MTTAGASTSSHLGRDKHAETSTPRQARRDKHAETSTPRQAPRQETSAETRDKRRDKHAETSTEGGGFFVIPSEAFSWTSPSGST
jgi:hypothetical protein